MNIWRKLLSRPRLIGLAFTSALISSPAISQTVADVFQYPLDIMPTPAQNVGDYYNAPFYGYHLGVDLPATPGTAVHAIANGVVKYWNWVPCLGNAVNIEHTLPDGSKRVSVYYHIEKKDVVLGTTVTRGQVVGYVRELPAVCGTGNHLHFGIRLGEYKTGNDCRTNVWFYPGYTSLHVLSCQDPPLPYLTDPIQDPSDPRHGAILAEWEQHPLAFIDQHSSPPPSSCSPTYTITDLGTLGGTSSYPLGINNNGQVVGFASTSGDTASHAFLYSGGAMIDLGTFGGTGSTAIGINDNGQVVGNASIAGNAASHAFLYSSGTMLDLGTLGGTNSGASGINKNGQVVGGADIAGGSGAHAFLYSGGVISDLGTLGGTFSGAWSINNTGQVVGESSVSGNNPTHAFLYSNGVMIDLGTLGGTTSYAYGINNNGQVVGTAYSAGDAAHAFRYSGGIMTDLGTLGGTISGAYGINSSGLVVGAANLPGDAESHAFLYDGTMQDLNNLIPPSSGWVLEEADAINDAGQITGHGSINGEHHGFVMTPTQKCAF